MLLLLLKINASDINRGCNVRLTSGSGKFRRAWNCCNNMSFIRYLQPTANRQFLVILFSCQSVLAMGDGFNNSTSNSIFCYPQDDIEDACRKRNMITLIIVCGFTMLGVGSYGAAYSQWIYVRFEKEVLGSNFSQFDMQA